MFQAKRGELAERRLTSRKRVSSCTGIWENKTIEYLENKAFLTYGVITKNVCFHLLNPFPTWTGPARPGPNALWTLISRKLSYLRKQIRDKKLVNDLKFIVLKFGIDSLNSLAAMTGFAKFIFCSFSLISREPRRIFSTWKMHQKGLKKTFQMVAQFFGLWKFLPWKMTKNCFFDPFFAIFSWINF